MNYAGSVLPQMEAAEQGYGQILWLYGPDDHLTEVGTMNLFVVLKTEDGGQCYLAPYLIIQRIKLFKTVTELVTPPLDNMILPGVTRDSILAIAREHASSEKHIPGLPHTLKVSERGITMKEVLKAKSEGRLLEIFGSGTAAIVSPVERIGYKGSDIDIPVGVNGIGPVTSALLQQIVGRQTGRIPSEWSIEVEKLGSS